MRPQPGSYSLIFIIFYKHVTSLRSLQLFVGIFQLPIIKITEIPLQRKCNFAKKLNITTSVKLNNPFVTSGYVSPDYFCNRGLRPKIKKTSESRPYFLKMQFISYYGSIVASLFEVPLVISVKMKKLALPSG